MTTVKFSDVVRRANYHVDKDNTDLLYYVGGEHFESESFSVTNRGLIKGSTIGPMFYFGFKPGDVLIVSRNPHLKKAGRVDFAGVCSEKTFVVETKDNNVLLQDYLTIIIQNPKFWDYAEKHKSGSVNYFLNWSTLEKYEFDLPPLEEQKRLAEILWAAEDLKRKYQNALIKTNKLLYTTFIQKFGEPFIDTNKWDFCRVSEIGSVVSGNTPKSDIKEYWDGNIKWITPAELNDDSFIVKDTQRHISPIGVKSTAVKLLPKGTVLLSSRAPIGKVAICGEEMYCNQGFKNIICSEKVNPYYLYAILKMKSDYLISLGSGSTFKELSKPIVENIKIIVPPRKLQDEFAEFVIARHKFEIELKELYLKIKNLQQTVLNLEI